MTKADIIDAVAVQAGVTKRQAGEILELILDEILSGLHKGERVALTPFGNFVVRQRRAREGRNPKTGDAIKIPARKVPAFIAGKNLKEAVGAGRAKKGGRKR